MKKIYYLNLKDNLGGGEVYAHFLMRAFALLEVDAALIISEKADFWADLDMQGIDCIPVRNEVQAIVEQLPAEPVIVLTNGSIPVAWREIIRQHGHKLVAIAHMPAHERSPEAYDDFDGVIGVSHYVLHTLAHRQVDNIYPEPWYGIADLERLRQATGQEKILRTSRYSWDRRKGRDYILGRLEPFYEYFRRPEVFVRKPGLTLGIVSGLVPIKQFPVLFGILAPILAEFPEVNLEIFGSGGYRSVADLDKALLPANRQVRFWGQQKNVSLIYPQLDYLMTGLPEKEALGLNVIEAQACGTPVLAVKNQPFTETVVEPDTGYFYVDPRQDGGACFRSLLQDLLDGSKPRPEPVKAEKHLQQFLMPAFVERTRATLSWLDA